MELNPPKKWPYVLAICWPLLILMMGGWWLYLLLQHTGPHFIQMVKWEGSFFLIMLFVSMVSFVFMYSRDLRKSQALSAFFASLTHELKTPLASIKLQSEVIQENLQGPRQNLQKLFTRLIEDTKNLEDELDNILQLSRIELNGDLNCVAVNLNLVWQKVYRHYKDYIEMEMNLVDIPLIWADEMALTIIIRNLLENTLKHSQQLKLPRKKVVLQFRRVDEKHLVLIYRDLGAKFNGEVKKLGTLFYKYNSRKGTGIGIYLIKKLLYKMRGQLKIENKDFLIFSLSFPLAVNGSKSE